LTQGEKHHQIEEVAFNIKDPNHCHNATPYGTGSKFLKWALFITLRPQAPKQVKTGS
jgi:hypothetical protein